jgi:hypothetical protein
MNRREMERTLDEWIASTYASARKSRRLPSGRHALKTYIIESNALDSDESRDAIGQFFAHEELSVPVSVKNTDDPSLYQIKVISKDVDFYLDTLDARYWVLHTISAAEAADSAVRSLVQRTRLLDSAWVPTEQLETWSGELGTPRVLTAKFSIPTGLYRDDLPEDEFLDDSFYLRIGSTGDARRRLNAYRESEALAPSLALWAVRIARRDADRDQIVVDDVTAGGKITCRGNSFRLHQELVLGLKNRYAELIEDWEATYRLDWESSGNSVRPTGRLAELILPHVLSEADAERLLSVLFNCGEPYRLYGVPVKNGELRFVVRAVDLHTGDKIDFELLSDMLRVYLFPTTCGNVLARLLTNLQHYHDARVRLA